jgi:hypothetical protein
VTVKAHYTKKIVDDKKMALQIGVHSQEDDGTYILYGLPLAPSTSENSLTEREIVKLQIRTNF